MAWNISNRLLATRFCISIFLVLFWLGSVNGQGENQALADAVKDVATLSEPQYYRYIFLRNPADLQLVSLTMNYISRSANISRPVPITPTLVRIDCRQYGPLTWRYVWGCLNFDPVFSLLITKDTATSAGIKLKPGENLVKLVSPHLDQDAFQTLSRLTASQAPIVSSRYLMYRALSTIKDDGVYAELYGGLYYDFIGLATGGVGTDEDVFFEDLGVGNVKQGITADKVFEKLRSDSRIAIFRSTVTSRPRRVDFLRTLVGKIEDNASLISVSHDIRAKDIDIGTHPVMNLLNFKDAAREVIWERANGLHGFVLFDGNGKRQDEVPPDIAADHNIPTPQATRLQPAIGCIRCHGSQSGWKIIHNDAKKLLTNLLDIFPNRKANDVDRLAGLYAGDVERKLLPRARDDYNAAILKATGPILALPGGIFAGKVDQSEIARVTAEGLSQVFKEYWYDLVTLNTIKADLGVKQLKLAIPLDGMEDPRIGAILSGIEINRSDYDLIYSFLATRVVRAAPLPVVK